MLEHMDKVRGGQVKPAPVIKPKVTTLILHLLRGGEGHVY